MICTNILMRAAKKKKKKKTPLHNKKTKKNNNNEMKQIKNLESVHGQLAIVKDDEIIKIIISQIIWMTFDAKMQFFHCLLK